MLKCRDHSRTRIAAVTTLLLASLVLPAAALAAKKEKPPYVYGPAPDWEKFKAMGEAAIRQILIDPESARFEWPNGYRQGGWKPIFEAKRYGYTTCGYVNSRNRMGGYVGRTAFVVVIDHDRVIHADVGKGGGLDFVSNGCMESEKRGMFPPLGTMAIAMLVPPSPSMPASRSGYGFAITPVPQGAYIRSLEMDSDAERFGLQTGMVISHINGIAIAGLGEVMQRLLEGSQGPVRLTVIGHGDYTLERFDGGTPAPVPMSKVGDRP